MPQPAKGDAQKAPLRWRGKVSAKAAAAADHHWQADRGAIQGRPARNRNLWRRVRVTLLLIFGAAGGAALLLLLLNREVQFPFVAVVKTAYRSPLPPNSWAYDDLESLRGGADPLDGKTIDVVDLSDADRTADSLLMPVPERRRQLLHQAQQMGVIVFYVSMHGLVNDSGQACVATPDSLPFDSGTWLPVTRLLQQIRNWELPDRVHKLLILDCNRQESNWNVGLVENSFAGRLQQALDETPVPNLVILNSTSPGQTGWASPEIRGTVFGQFLRLGLAGAADLRQEGGNHDYRVSLSELYRYVLRHVDGWSQQNRGARQQPLLVPATTVDYVLTCSLNRSMLQRLLSKFASDAAPEPTLSRRQLDELWAALASLGDAHADSLAPLEMSELRRRIVWLERSSSAGEAYRLETNAAEREWRRLADRLRERVALPNSPSFANAGGASYRDVAAPGVTAKLHSLPLLAQMGRGDPAAIEALAANLKRLQTESLFANFDSLLAFPATKDLAASASIVHFAKLLRRSRELRSDAVAAGSFLGTALELQSLADSAAVPVDPRSQPWIRGAIDAADRSRRAVDDSVLTGAAPAGGAESNSIEAAKQAYQDVTAIDKAVAEAWQFHDRIAAELPFLARWLETASRGQHDAEPAARESTSELLTLVGAMQLLSRLLDDPPAADVVPIAGNLAFTGQYQAVRAQYESLRRRFDDAGERLIVAAELNPAAVAQAAALLDLPLLPTRTTENGLSPLEQRRTIQSRYTQASGDLHRRFMEELAKPASNGAAPNPSATRPAVKNQQSGSDGGKLTAQGSATSPAQQAGAVLLALLETAALGQKDKAGADITAALSTDESGARIRRVLRSVPGEIEAARQRHTASVDQPRREWAAAAGLARVTAPLMDGTGPSTGPSAGPSSGQFDAVAELRRVDIQQLLLWQAGRYLEDFWGPGVHGEPEFFDKATTDSIDAARAVCIPNPAAARQIGDLQSLLTQRHLAAREGLTVRADAVLVIDAADRPKAHVAVATTPAGAGRGLPVGRAALHIADSRGQSLGPAVDFPVGQSGPGPAERPREQIDVPLGPAVGELADTIAKATALFRGHEFADDLVVRAAGGTTVEFRPRRVTQARVRVHGSKRQRASVVFVLDCSASMRKLMEFETPDSVVPRMEVAKAALIRMMNALAARGDARVGVLLYGHRVGWSTKEPNQLLTQAAWGGQIPEGLKPYEDVETILPLGRFDSIAAAKVTQRLEKVKPWGETPLYLALAQALAEFKEDDPDAQRSVVVITDGVNYQFNPRPEKAKTTQDVLTAATARKIPLHIVGFGIQPDEAAEAQREFGRLARETGGHYVSVSEAAALADTLEEILQRRPYSVVSPAGVISKAALGTAIEVTWDGDDPQDYTVAIDALSQPVELTGQEAVELFVSQDGQSLLSAAYEAGAPLFEALVGGSLRDSAGIRLGVHQPVHEGSTVTFDLSLQHAEQKFVRRPREVWIEITPILSDNRPAANRKYVVYDAEFVPQTPVPVLRAVARDWPKEARRARIDFWCKWTATEPSLVIPFSNLPDPALPAPAPTALDGISGLKYQAREKPGLPLRVDFIETYAPDTPGGTMLKVDIVGPQLPTRALHQFDEANRFATHTFLFENVSRGALWSSAAIRVISRRRMLDDASHLEVPVLIDVPAQSDTLPSVP